MKEKLIKEIVLKSLTNQNLAKEEKWFRMFKSKIDIDLDTNILVLDKDLFKEMSKTYKKADNFHLLFAEGIWRKNKFSNPIMTFEQFKKSFN